MSRASKFAAMLIVAGGLTAAIAAPVRASCGGYIPRGPIESSKFNPSDSQSPEEAEARQAQRVAQREARRAAKEAKKAAKEQAVADAAAAKAPATTVAAND